MKRLAFGTLSAFLLATSVIQPSLAIESVLQGNANESSFLVAKKSVVASGQFVTVKKQSTGSAQIISKGGKRYLELSTDFSTAKGPDVKVVLSRQAQVPGSIEEGTYVTLAPLQKFQGKQLYEIPSDIDLDDYASVALWCRQFNVTFGYAPLS
ncbi:DM13 domain-containing protein [Acaryochloris sp. CCMEE 5410]|uniref:DM13 domain-containing protein n=1 Tax=Acaryochloris sp. CCMEE 5410 TaxID=310037 RepID=UPI0002484FE9|nr:DM13 domain-containing protein [Acaryochloris sp. CCMEE 5410]KAI9134939.1 DM13 domain-containing protein [Acaryochloris sp. CCMEE 5410]